MQEYLAQKIFTLLEFAEENSAQSPAWLGASSDLQQLQTDKQIISIPQDIVQNLYNFTASCEEELYKALRQGTQRCCEMPKRISQWAK